MPSVLAVISALRRLKPARSSSVRYSMFFSMCRRILSRTGPFALSTVSDPFVA